ncbi:MAG: 1-(5-phosphoribosyl)-5-[(5-phosphoribosylamino) methylideneamino]imidazole-4-carboxamide isomerase [Bacteroidia bacterium]
MQMRIIPAIDLIDGTCVRLETGDYRRKTVYHEDPVAVAQQFEAAGLRHLHLVDLDGARVGRVVNLPVLARICRETGLVVDFGGGIKTHDDLMRVFDAGAAQVNIGSLAVRDREALLAWLAQHGPARFILSADVRDGKIAVHGWQEQTSLDLTDFVASYLDAGLGTVTCTDISRDGRLAGPATDLYRDLLAAFPGLQLIASGGIASLDDLSTLADLGLWGAITGKALYEGRIDLAALGQWIADREG